jgi:geranylgeranyl diphosphate synthase type II
MTESSRRQAGVPAAFAAPLGAIERHLSEVCAGLRAPPNLRDAVAYALLGGGKRLRPLLAWHCCAAAAGEASAGRLSLGVGAAAELVHAFSLVHDDLPAMDDDDLRRGRPTLHVHAGEAMAILAGDAMLAFAFGVLARVEGASPTLRIRLVEELTAGTMGMISGQVLDTLGGFAAQETPGQRVERIHREKTGALIVAACRMGALVGLAGRPDAESTERLAAISRYAEAIGLMFQIVDDLVDVEQPAEHAGKRTGKDAEAGKLTWPGVHGVEASRAKVEEFRVCAVDAARSLGPAAEALEELAGYLARRTR